MRCRYVLLETKIKTRICYGVAIFNADLDSSDNAEILQAYIDLSSNRQMVASFVELCNRLQLSIVHFQDAVDDFVSSI